jgi:hypothetical protein
MKKYYLCIAIVLVLIWASEAKVWAQSAGATSANITGNVTDEQEASLGGAIVTIKNLQTNFVRETSVGEDGSYSILQLTPGNYEITVSQAGFTTYVSQLEVVLGTTLLLNFKLKVGETSDVIEVISSNMNSFGKTESSSNNNLSRIQNLPINRRNFLGFSLTSPRVTQDRFPGQGVAATSGLSFNGQPARFNNFTIDGVDNNEPFSGAVLSTLSQDAVQEFQVISDSYSAEFGRAFGGIVNIVTRGGTNEFRGSLFGFLRNDKTSSRDVFSSFKPEFKQYQFGISLGGPIKKEKAFFFAAFERLSVKQNQFVTISDMTIRAAQRVGFPITNGPLPFSIGTTSVLLRTNFKLSAQDNLYLRYNGGFTYNGAREPFGGLIGQTNGGIEKLRDNSVAVNNTYVSSSNFLINETRFIYGQRKQQISPIDPNGPQIQIFAPEGLVVFGRRTLLPQPREQKSFQFVNNTSLSLGKNQIKFGLDLVYINNPVVSLPITEGGIGIFTPLNLATALGIANAPSLSALESFDPSLRSPQQKAGLMLVAQELPNLVQEFPRNVPLGDLSLPFAFIQGFGDANTPLKTALFSAFLQDDIRVNRNFLLKLGVRYDVNRVTAVPDNAGNFSPRISFSYKVNSRLSLNGGYGLFFSFPLLGGSTVVRSTDSGNFKVPVVPFPFSTIPFSLPSRRLPTSSQVPSQIPFIPQLSLVFRFQKDLRSSYAQQAKLAFDYLIDNDTVLSLSYIFIRGVKLISLNNINPIVRPVNGNPISSAVTGRIDVNQGDVFLYTSAFDSYYNAGTISLNRRLVKNFSINASYTFSKAIDNFQDFLRNELESNNALDLKGERGLSLQDVRSRFLFSGVWELNYTQSPLLKDFKLSSIISLESGKPFNLLAGEDINLDGDNPPGDRPLGIARNAGITPGFANVDLRLTRKIKFKDKLQIEGFVETFNLFNRVNISELDRVFPRDSQNKFNLPKQKNGRFIATPNRFRNAFAPRQIQFGFRLEF